MDLVNIRIGTAGLVGLLGYCVVFIGLILLMVVVMLIGKVMIARNEKEKAAAGAVPVKEVAETAAPSAKAAPGTAGDVKLYDTDPKDAAMIMAIVADTLGKPLNELRFKSIREVK